MIHRIAALMVLAAAQVLAPLPALAQAAADAARPFASPEVVNALPAGGVGSLGQVTLALLVVLGTVFGIAWLTRRLRGLAVGGTQAIEVIAQVGLGTRERAVLVRVGGAHVLLGVAPGRVSALHVLPPDAVLDVPPGDAAASGAASAAPTRPSFAALLKRSLGR